MTNATKTQNDQTVETRTYYKVVTKSFADDRHDTLEEAQQALEGLGKTVKPEYREYWEGVRRAAYIAKVTETIEKV